MITFKPIIIQGGRRKDGTWPVKIRVTFKGKCRRLPTTLVCTDGDLTRGGRIKSATIQEKAGELITRMRSVCADLSPFVLEAWTVDEVVSHIRSRLSQQSFRLDFFTYAEGVLADMTEHTAAAYRVALRSFARFLGGPSLDINSITRQMLLQYIDFINHEPLLVPGPGGVARPVGRPKRSQGNTAARNVARLGTLFARARNEYNDEDAGIINIPRSPFSRMPKVRAAGLGQRALTIQELQALIDAIPEDWRERIARAAFLVSFATCGANMADLWEAVPVTGRKWRYFRRKTRGRRTDRAEVVIALNAKADTFVRVLQEEGPDGWWLPVLHRWSTADIATHTVNRGLRSLADRLGLEPFSFYAARHTWAVLARRCGVEKATVDEALAHIGDFRVTDIYAGRNWDLVERANEKVLELVKWPCDSPEK